MSDDVPGTWLVGVVAHDDALSGVRVHAGHLAAGPASGRDHRVQVRLRFEGVTGTGFPDATTSRRLLEREETITVALEGVSVLVAVLTVPGFRELVFHTADPTATRERLDERCAGVVDDVDVSVDPAWTRYRSLFADALPADTDRRRIHEVAAASAESAPSRAVAHTFAFPTLAEADQAAAALRDAGLVVTFEGAADTAEPAPPRFTIVDTETLTQVDMARSRDALRGFAVSWGGEYTGWVVVGS